MPVTRENVIAIKEETLNTVALEPAVNIFNSLVLLFKVEHVSGFNEWVYRTASRLSKELMWNHRLVFEGLHYTLTPEHSLPTFSDYIRQMASADPLHLRHKLFDAYLHIRPEKVPEGSCPSQYITDTPDEMEPEQVLGSAQDYIQFLETRFGKGAADVELETAAYRLVIDPPAMQKFIVAHLWNMWDEVMNTEWERVEPMLQEAVRAFQKVDLRGKSNLEAAELILDTSFSEEHDKLKRKLENAQRITFIPSAHIGPYQYDYGFSGRKWLVFGMHSPRGMAGDTPELNRAEVLVRMSALSDETRLRILQIIAAAGSLNASEVMTHLGVSQSAASRHLMQLSATGYLMESRVQGVKQYTLNPKRIEETLQAVSAFLLKK